MATQRLTEDEIKETIEAVRKHGSISAAAVALGVPRNTIGSRIQRGKELGLDVPRKVYATSTLIRGEEGDGFALQWVKEKADQAVETRAEMIAALKDELRSIKPLPRIKTPRRTLADYLAVLPFGDPHLGQYSWGDETGDDYDLDIAEQLHVDAVDNLVCRLPPVKTGLLISVGDTTHGDNSTNRTPASQHSLDVDTRFRKVLKVTIRTFERCISRMLERFENVEVVIVPGNHDPHASAAIVIGLACLYRNNPRVRIEESPAKFIYKRHGKCLIGITHGDTCKLEKLGELMANDRAKDWGETEFRHWFTGHWHHRKVIEGVGFTAEVLRTLAGKDAYAASHAYRSLRDMYAVIFDKEQGELERYRVDVKALQRAA